MTQTIYSTPNEIRTLFSRAMSEMYQKEVPQYENLMHLVQQVNDEVLEKNAALQEQLKTHQQLDRLNVERHGAIRVGTPQELHTLRRLFAVMGMEPVGYYDLTVASVPVHSTAFRPVTDAALAHNPFRVFTSLLRLELIEDEALREKAAATLDQRTIFTPRCLELIQQFEQIGGLTPNEANEFVAEALYTFKWHNEATVDSETYTSLRAAHPLIADVVCFKGPHINHLTPRTLDIDEVQSRMPTHGMQAKEIIEGPPARQCPILLRQTSFMALSEPIYFAGTSNHQGTHSARFGEVEQRGVALTPKGRTLYDTLLAKVRERSLSLPKENYAENYNTLLTEVFTDFPDNYEALRKQELAYFAASPNLSTLTKKRPAADADWDTLVNEGYVSFTPITYEDFLPVSAAGIFQSNLGNENANKNYQSSANKNRFEDVLGCAVHDEMYLYNALEQQSIRKTLQSIFPKSF